MIDAAVVKMVLSVTNPAAPRYAEVPTPSSTEDSVTNELLKLVSNGDENQGMYLHVGPRELICAWRNWGLARSLDCRCQQLHVGLLVRNDEL